MVVSLSTCGLIACAPTGLYYWGDYEDRLQAYYSEPSTRPAFLYAVRAIIEESESRGVSPPPGLCMEYGIALYQSGYHEEAIEYLNKEYSYWPESAVVVTAISARISELESPISKPAGEDMYWLPGGEPPGWGDTETIAEKKRRRRR